MTRNPYTRQFYPKPHNDDDGIWLYYECSKCGKMLDAKRDESDLLQKQFLEHVKIDHAKEIRPREDFSQAAARIVREATERN